MKRKETFFGKHVSQDDAPMHGSGTFIHRYTLRNQQRQILHYDPEKIWFGANIRMKSALSRGLCILLVIVLAAGFEPGVIFAEETDFSTQAEEYFEENAETGEEPSGTVEMTEGSIEETNETEEGLPEEGEEAFGAIQETEDETAWTAGGPTEDLAEAEQVPLDKESVPEEVVEADEDSDSGEVVEAGEESVPEEAVEADDVSDSGEEMEADEESVPKEVVEEGEVSVPEEVVEEDEVSDSGQVVEAGEVPGPEEVVETDEVSNPEELLEAGEVSDPGEVTEAYEMSDSGIAVETPEVSDHEEVTEAGEMNGSEEVPETELLSEDGQEESFSENSSNEYVAGDSCGENTRWELDYEGTLTISGEGAVENASWDYYDDDITAVIIKEGVTSIPFMAFQDYINLESLSVPESLTTIGVNAFLMTSLKHIDVPNIYYWLDYGYNIDCADSGWNLYFNGELVTDYIIPDDVTDISNAFWDCESLRSVIIPGTMASIGSSAFRGCRNLVSVTIPEGVSEIEYEAFMNCSSLTQISLPANLKSIGDEAFSGCTCLTGINIPDTLTDFGNKVFYGTPWIQEKNGFIIRNGELLHYDEISVDVEIPEEVTAIGARAFYMCRDLKTVVFPPTLKSIGEEAFSSCSGLTGIEIPEGAKLGGSAFDYCSGLQRVVLPDDLENIPNYCFSHCRSLTDIRLPEHLSSISWWAFDSCTSLTEVTIPKSLNFIAWRAFGDCTSLSKVTFNGGEYAIASDAFIDNAENLTFYGYGDTPAQEYAEDYGISFIVVKPRSLQDAVLRVTDNGMNCEYFSYTGQKICPTVEVRFEKTFYHAGDYMSSTRILKAGEDYEAVFSNNINPGKGLVTVTGKGAYTGSLKKTFTITPADMWDVKITGIENKTYTGKEIRQTATLKLGSMVLQEGRDYKVRYSNNINAGKAYVYFVGIGNYYEEKERSFVISKAAQTISAKAAASSVAVGRTTTVSISGSKGSKSFKSSDTAIATVSSKGVVTAKKVGTVKITATSAETTNYKAASKTVTIKVVPAATSSVTAVNQATGIKLTWKKVTGANGYKIYRGSTAIKTITSGSTVTFTDTKADTNGTKYTFKIVARASTGYSTLSKTVTVYKVARPAVSSVTNSASGKMTVKWGKNAKANGYQIQYSTDKTFKSGNKTVTISSASTVSKVIGGLTKGKTYYVRIRTHKTVGSTKYWSVWSAAKGARISK